MIHIGFQKLALGLLLGLAVLGMGGSYYFYHQYQELAANPTIEVKKEVDTLVSAVGALIELPQDEIPTVATILDTEKLANQPFFLKGQNGDKLLAYRVAKTAILYRPSTGKIINVAPITETEPTVSSDVMKKSDEKHLHRIAYFNGTDIIGKAYLAEKTVQEKYPDIYTTVAVANAVKKNYEGALVIDLVGDHREEVRALADLLGGRVGVLPEGETAPDADVLVISGI